MTQDQLYIYANNYRMGLALSLLTSFIFIGLKFHLYPLPHMDYIVAGACILSMSLVAAFSLHTAFRDIKKNIRQMNSKRKIFAAVRRIMLLKLLFVLPWLIVLFWPIYPDFLFDHILGHVYVLSSITIITTASAVCFPLFIWDLFIYLGFALLMTQLNKHVQEMEYLAYFLALWGLNAIIAARQLNKTTTLLAGKTFALERAVTAAKMASKAKSDFLSMMSHEIRTPMNGILGMLGFLRETNLTEEQRESVEVISSCSNTLLNTLNDVLDIAKVEAGKLSITNENFDILSLLKSTARIIEPLAEEKGLTLRVDMGDDVPQWIVSDPNRIQQVTVNFMNNAVKFTDTGSVTLKVRKIVNSGSAFIRVEVIDTGIGISKPDQAKLFQRFSQIEDGKSRSVKGAGLGLAISKKLIFLMNGRIGVISEKGAGTTFWYEIPLNKGEAPQQSITSEQIVSALDQRESLTILLAEDNRINQMIAQKLLSQRGHNVVTADNGAEAIEAIRKGTFDLVFMDIQMPGVDGIQATRKIKNMGPPYKDVPIIAMTAFTQKKFIDACKQAGMANFISKPFRPDDLDKLLARYAPQREAAPTAAIADTSNEYNYLATLVQEFGEDYTRSFIDSSITEIRRLVGLLEKAHNDNDPKGIMIAAHDLKGLSGNLGFNKIHTVAKDLEANSSDKSAEIGKKVAEIMAVVDGEVSNLKEKIEDML